MKAIDYRRSASENPGWLAQQAADCQKHARENGLTIVASYTDTGYPLHGLDMLLDAAARDDIAAVVVANPALLGRKPDDHLRTLEQLHEAGVEVHTADQWRERTRAELIQETLLAYAEADEQRIEAAVNESTDD